MKVCEVLIGPIAGNGGIVYNEGEEIILEDATAEQFERWTYVKILRDAEDGSPVAGRAAEPTPTEPVTESPLPGAESAVLGSPQVEHLSKTGDLPVEPKVVATTTTKKSTTTSTAEA